MPGVSGLTDRELVDAVMRGEWKAADAFCDRFMSFVWHVLWQDFGLRGEEIEDLHQEVFLLLHEDGYRRLRSWRGGERDSFVSYLRPIVKHAALDFLRRRGRDVAPPDDPREPEAVDPRGANPEERALVAERRRWLRECMERLHPREREVVRLRYESERDYRGIADRLRLTVTNVGAILTRARSKLRECLSGMAPELFSEMLRDLGEM